MKRNVPGFIWDYLQLIRRQLMRVIESPRLRQGWLAWPIILFPLLLFLAGYMLPGFVHGADDIVGPYGILATIPLTIGAYLREHRGAIISWVIVSIGMMAWICLEVGFRPWPSEIIKSWILIDGGALIFNLALGQLQVVSRRLSEAHNALKEVALVDTLTGLPNHRAMLERLEKEVAQAVSSGRPLSILFFDADHFKHINDTYGHAAGDAVLRELGKRVYEMLRTTDLLGRYGGEEFVAILPGVEQRQARLIAERILHAVSERNMATELAEGGISVTVSMGIADYPGDVSENTAFERICSALLMKADKAMYWAKLMGRNQVRNFSELQEMSYNGNLPVLSTDERPSHQTKEQAIAGEEPHKLETSAEFTDSSVLQTLTTIASVHDGGTSDHAQRMVQLAVATARMLERSEEEVHLVQLAAQLHDIGKIGIPDAILHKPGPLTDEEWSVMRRHPSIGRQILLQAGGVFELLSHIVVAHHERWDGNGYPNKLYHEEIPLGARILSVVDSYDAMTSDRPYRKALPVEKARVELLRCAGSQFDPKVVEAFLRVLDVQVTSGELPTTNTEHLQESIR